MTHEFQNTLFRSAAAMCDAIAYEWLTAGGANDAAFVAEALAEATDEALATEAIEGWGLEEVDEDGETWLEARGADAAAVAAAFAALRDAGSDLILVRSDAGDGGWSLHAPGSTDEQIAEGDAPALLTGEAEMVNGEWDAPTQTHRAAAALMARA